MAYKLYEFKDPKLDEQIRLICDQLTNNRDSLLFEPTLVEAPPRFEPYLSKGVSRWGIAEVVTSVSPNPAVQVFGCGAGNSGAIGGSYEGIQSITSGAYEILRVNTTLNNSVDRSFGASGTNANASGFRLDCNPFLQITFHTSASVANAEYFVGLAGLGSTTTWEQDWIGIYFLSTGNANWALVKGINNSQTTLYTSTTSVTADTQYILQLQTVRINNASQLFDIYMRIYKKVYNTTTGAITSLTQEQTIIHSTAIDGTSPDLRADSTVIPFIKIRNKTAGASRDLWWQSMYAEQYNKADVDNINPYDYIKLRIR